MPSLWRAPFTKVSRRTGGESGLLPLAAVQERQSGAAHLVPCGGDPEFKHVRQATEMRRQTFGVPAVPALYRHTVLELLTAFTQA